MHIYSEIHVCQERNGGEGSNEIDNVKPFMFALAAVDHQTSQKRREREREQREMIRVKSSEKCNDVVILITKQTSFIVAYASMYTEMRSKTLITKQHQTAPGYSYHRAKQHTTMDLPLHGSAYRNSRGEEFFKKMIAAEIIVG